jgi:hypothetical protein
MKQQTTFSMVLLAQKIDANSPRSTVFSSAFSWSLFNTRASATLLKTRLNNLTNTNNLIRTNDLFKFCKQKKLLERCDRDQCWRCERLPTQPEMGRKKERLTGTPQVKITSQPYSALSTSCQRSRRRCFDLSAHHLSLANTPWQCNSKCTILRQAFHHDSITMPLCTP